MIIDFKEIPEAHKGSGLQDTWELFCRDFLASQGYEILSEPARGADNGLDIKARHNNLIWLVSCKHKAHSGIAVSSTSDEINIRDRVESNECDGFIGFYSTIASSGLKTILEGLKGKMPYILFDREKIEQRIVGYFYQEKLFMRFFPSSFKKFKEIYFYREPINLFVSHFENNYDKGTILLYEILFSSIKNLIPYLRKELSFEETLNEQNIKLLLIENIEDMRNGSYKFKYSDKIEMTNYSINDFLEKLIPNEVEFIYGLKIPSVTPVSFGVSPDEGFWAYYVNYIVCSPQFIKKNNDIFKQLAEILK